MGSQKQRETNVQGQGEEKTRASTPTYGIFGSDQDVVDRLARVSINVLRDAQLSALRVDVEEGVLVLTLEAVRQRVEQRPKLRTVRVCGHDLKKSTKKPRNLKLVDFCSLEQMRANVWGGFHEF